MRRTRMNAVFLHALVRRFGDLVRCRRLRCGRTVGELATVAANAGVVSTRRLASLAPRGSNSVREPTLGFASLGLRLRPLDRRKASATRPVHAVGRSRPFCSRPPCRHILSRRKPHTMVLQISLRNLPRSVRQSRRRIGDRPLVTRNPRMARIVQSQLSRPRNRTHVRSLISRR
jgi:hypothetical protein